ncbi:hypothetical protein, partial [Mycobacterium marinum]|uniref:hypothetical protein n=1 Tax=Mycobacterium marinum TaxID=1781 RepID=UPI0035696DCA
MTLNETFSRSITFGTPWPETQFPWPSVLTNRSSPSLRSDNENESNVPIPAHSIDADAPSKGGTATGG